MGRHCVRWGERVGLFAREQQGQQQCACAAAAAMTAASNSRKIGSSSSTGMFGACWQYIHKVLGGGSTARAACRMRLYSLGTRAT